jgi:hypothetical protein
MAVTLLAADIADLIITTQNELGRMKMSDLASELQEYFALPRILKGKEGDVETVQNGAQIEFNAMVNYDKTSAKMTSLHAVDNINVTNNMATGKIDWRYVTSHYAVEERELLMNRGDAQIVSYIKSKRLSAQLAMAQLLEDQFWAKPSTSLDLYGLGYWLTYNATEGFNGGNQTGYSDGPGGLSCLTYTKWKNYTAQYTQVSKSDLINKARTASRMTRFMPPVEFGTYNTGDKYGYYTNNAVVLALESILEAQNDNLGKSVNPMDNQVLLNRISVNWVPKLEDYTASAPFIGINWGEFKPVFMQGEQMNEQAPKEAPMQHRSLVVHTDMMMNYICRDRRKQFLIAKADPWN